MQKQNVMRLFPSPVKELALEGLYLEYMQQCNADTGQPFVYTNFISSLDGRIAIEHPQKNGHHVPEAIANPRDWRLFQELAATADVLVTSARYIRQLAEGRAQDGLPLSTDSAFNDLHAWRSRHGMTPQPAVVILSSSLDVPVSVLSGLDRDVYVVTGSQADAEAVDRITQAGLKVLFAGQENKVEGNELIRQLAALGYRNIYSIAGPGVLDTLLQAGVLNRLFLTQVHRLIGGASYDTLLEGRLVVPPANFSLQALYYDRYNDEESGQMFAVFDTGSIEHTSR